MKIKTDSDDFFRDNSSNALINNNVNAYRLYKQQRDSHSKSKELQDEIDNLKQDISEIKFLLNILINKKE